VSDVDLLPDDGAGQVTLITLHSAKGLEFPVVFLVGLEEGLLPISRAIEAEYSNPQPMEEERRLFYVGITRAEQLLYLSYASARQLYGRYTPGVPSRFLASIPQNTLQTLTRTYPRPSQGSLRERARQLTRPDRNGASGLGSLLSGRSVALPAAPVALPTYSVGQRVFHAKFGEGHILELHPRPNDQEHVVACERHGTKRLMASLAPLDVIG
jgi:DNA helicase-2/ATP-dependent DNA helicase PcrA